ncbi:sigma-54-dependent Fis family transcriptional regulator [Pseudomonas indica]|uniref:Transcriptional regulator of acetoin/glycerol metabolism n=1 Tax=Pseudomonas indica TaxID=137658 RepID=A0A1G9MVM6_9PSED|nr:sigma-54-dependent Fis family transcriptional regulator [Pseudomonas indica]MBU3058243.1 sigma-54-dependent Fis family transcriptional regulator [Pseudomonas indica]SDL78081.1 Transcriptional regulator of acetoin/glycerol metabolism [Pseudomonas indica]
MHANHLIRHAQQVLTVAQGKAQASGPAADPSIARSWLRCLEQYHLDPALPMAPAVLEHGRMLECRERLQQVLEIANGEMNSLYRQLSGSGHAVLLTDSRGVILNCVTAAAERPTFERAGLWLGADWSEAREGTNGIGTCLVERQALTIHQDEHFRSRHTGLTCSASPVFDPYGDLLAVLDVSSARHDVSRQSQFHTMALVNLSAKMIESCYFLRRFEGEWLLRFHLQADYVGLFSEGLLAFDGEGRIKAANQSALNLLGGAREQLLGQPLEAFFDCRLDDLLGRASPQPAASWPLRTRQGRLLFASLRGQPRSLPVPPPAAPVDVQAKPAASGLCLGDERLRNDFRRALRVFERDVPLLLHGETGSGKEAFAKAVHQASSRAGKPFVALNCAAIPESLIESELFGYRGGTFTGARKEGMRGKLQQADGGTLFLDEIGDMPLALQTRLLRVLEERQVVPIGGEAQTVDVRIVSATHRALDERVAAGTFREDLYYRLNGLVLDLPPLRARSDKPELLEHLLAEEARGEDIRLERAAREALLAYDWPGNVRQLRNVLRTLAALCEDGRVRLDDLPTEIRQALDASQAEETAVGPLEEAERTTLIAALDSQRWHMTRTAEQLGISRNTLYRKLRKHGIGTRG